MTTLTLSANSLEKANCLARYYLYKVLGRRPAVTSPGAIAGSAMHAGIAAMVAGKSTPEQDSALLAVLDARPIPASDKEYRTRAYLLDALAAFRAEWSAQASGWQVEEQESQGVRELGEVSYWRPTGPRLPAALSEYRSKVFWEYRRDLVAIGPDGLRYLTDWKTMSRDEEAAVKSYQNAGQFMGYVWSWLQEHPDKPIAGVLVRRIILRKPSKSGTAFEFPVDKPILFAEGKVEEWRAMTLRRARDILERDPANSLDWPQAATEVGLCRHQWGCCGYLEACAMGPKDRATRLAMDDFEDTSSSDKPTVEPTANGGD